MAKVRKRTKAFMVSDGPAERTFLWCLCGRVYVFNGNYTLTTAVQMRSQIPCHCLGEGLVDLPKLVKYINVTTQNTYQGRELIPIDSSVSLAVDTSPYSISRKTVTSSFNYDPVRKQLKETNVTSGITVKNVPGQTPKILRWQRGAGDKDDIKDVTYIGGAQNLNNDFVQQSWLHLRPNSSDPVYSGTRLPINGVDLMYFLALPAIGRVGELVAVSDKFCREATGRNHMNPDSHLLSTLVVKGDTIDVHSPMAFSHMICGSINGDVAVAALNSSLSWPTIHFMAHVLKNADPKITITSLGVEGPYWTFHDQMLSDRIMSNYMNDLWDFFKYLKTKMTAEQIVTMLKSLSHGTAVNSVAIISRRIYDILVMYRRIVANEEAKKWLQEGMKFTTFPGKFIDGNHVESFIHNVFNRTIKDPVPVTEAVLKEAEATTVQKPKKRVSSTTVSKRRSNGI